MVEPIIVKVTSKESCVEKGSVLVIIPEDYMIEGEYTWGRERTGRSSPVHKGTYAVTDATDDEIHLATMLGRGCPSQKHGHWVKRKDLPLAGVD